LTGVMSGVIWTFAALLGSQDAHAQGFPGQLVLAGGDAIVFPPDAEPLFGQGYLGIEMLDLNPQLRQHFGARNDVGVLVAGVEADSPAARAGVKVGDVIVAVDGEPTTSSWELIHAVRPRAAGDSLQLEVVRDRQQRRVTAVLVERERQPVVYQGLGMGGDDASALRDALTGACGSFSDPGLLFGVESDRQAEVSAMEARMLELEGKIRELERMLSPSP
jgi:membrane-associated protease RseP (regulator of RpoE activity)